MGRGLAQGFDQRLSGATARGAFGWRPKHLDPEREIGMLPWKPDAIIARFYLRVTVSFPPPSLLR